MRSNNLSFPKITLSQTRIILSKNRYLNMEYQSVSALSEVAKKSTAIVPSANPPSRMGIPFKDKMIGRFQQAGMMKKARPQYFYKQKKTDVQFTPDGKGFLPIGFITEEEMLFLRENYEHIFLVEIQCDIVVLLPPGTEGLVGIALYDTRLTKQKYSRLISLKVPASQSHHSVRLSPNYAVSTKEDLTTLWSALPLVKDVPISQICWPFHVQITGKLVATNELVPPVYEAAANCIKIAAGNTVAVDDPEKELYEYKERVVNYDRLFSDAMRRRDLQRRKDFVRTTVRAIEPSQTNEARDETKENFER